MPCGFAAGAVGEIVYVILSTPHFSVNDFTEPKFLKNLVFCSLVSAAFNMVGWKWGASIDDPAFIPQLTKPNGFIKVLRNLCALLRIDIEKIRNYAVLNTLISKLLGMHLYSVSDI